MHTQAAATEPSPVHYPCRGGKSLRFPFGRSSRRRELEEVRKRIEQLRVDIERLEHTAEEVIDDSDATEAYRSVQRLRGSMAREELTAKRQELRQLLARESELETDRVERPTGMFTIPTSPPVVPVEVPPAAQVSGPLPAEKAIIEPAIETKTEPDTVALPALEPARTDAEVATAALMLSEPPADVVEPEPIAAESEPVVVEPVAEEAVTEEIPVVPEAEPSVAAEAAEAPRSKPRTGLIAVITLLGLAAIAIVGAIALGFIPLGPMSLPTPVPTRPVIVAPPSPSPSPLPSPSQAPATATVAPATATPVPPTPLPPTAVVEQPPDEPIVAPEPDFEPEISTEPAIGSVVVQAPPGFTGAFLRTEPSMAAVVIRLLTNGTRVDLLSGEAFGTGFRWARVRSAEDGVTGWVVANTVGR